MTEASRKSTTLINMKEEIANAILQRRTWLTLGILLFYFLYVMILLTATRFSPLVTLAALLLPLILFELALRGLLLFSFGRRYRYALFNYFLVDHPRYGFEFRKNIHSKRIAFPIFDRFVF